MGYDNIEKDAKGFLVNAADWTEEIAKEMASADGISELTPRHWDLINYLREEFFENNGNQPNERHMAKAMAEKWGSATTKDLYDLFPKQPSKQGGKIAGLPETKRKGGY